jgi:hypothetical protein
MRIMKNKTVSVAAIALALVSSSLAPLAQAGPYYGGRHWGGAHAHFIYAPGRWHGGRWVQSWHGGRYGWWWLVGSSWLLYPAPVYPYPNPNIDPVYIVDDSSAVAASTVIAPAPMATVPPAPTQTAPRPPQAQVWYYCQSPQGYYPYVPACPSGWQTVPSTPADLQ